MPEESPPTTAELVDESLIPKKLKVKLKQAGKEGRIELLKDYIDYIVRTNRSLPPDFQTFIREVTGADDRAGFIHLRVWSDNAELVQMVRAKGYEHRVDQYD